MGVILNRITGENVTVLLPTEDIMPPTFCHLWMQTLTGSDYTPNPNPSPPQFPRTLQGAQFLTSTTTQCSLYALTTTSQGHSGFLASQDHENKKRSSNAK